MEVLLLETAEAEVYSYINKEQSEERVTYRMGQAGPGTPGGERGRGCLSWPLARTRMPGWLAGSIFAAMPRAGPSSWK